MFAQTFLFVPANRLERLPKALATGTDAVIIDLEDAVATADKAFLRQTLIENLQACDGGQIWLRINGADTPDFADDVALLHDLPNLAGVVLPKVASSADVEILSSQIDLPIIAMIESAKGLVNLASIAKAKGVVALSYGVLDLLLSLGVKQGTPQATLVLDKVRTDLLIHSVAFGLNPPIETVFTDLSDDNALISYVQNWQNMGFGGQLLIHPKQVALVKTIQNTDRQSLAFAQKVLDTHQKTGQDVFVVDGQMVDLPVVVWAKEILAKG